MPEVSIKDQLNKLIEIQKLDKEIFDYNQDLKEKPQQIQKLKEIFEGTKAHLNELENKSKSIQVERSQKETDLDAKEGEIAKANSALNDLKTNKEYQAKIKEIENLKADKSRIEEEILLSFDKLEAVNKEIDEEKKVVDGHEKEYLSKKKEVEDLVADLTAKVKDLEARKNQLTPDLDANLLARYNRILEMRDGVAIVPVNSGSCGGCYMNVMPQVINTIKRADEIIVCEFCSRILYLEDE